MKETLFQKLDEVEKEAVQAFRAQDSEDSLYQAKVRFLGKKGLLTGVLKGLGALPSEDRPQVGERANSVKATLETLYDELLLSLKKKNLSRSLAESKTDITLPGIPWPKGHYHPISIVLNQIKEIFRNLGFDICEGPEIETDYYNFEALNIPKDHPARDMQDTFYLGAPIGPEGDYSCRSNLGRASDGPQTPAPRTGKAGSSAFPRSPMGSSSDYLLRTHTSPVQIRVMERKKPPIRMIAPGVVYRRDSDVTHSPMFHQVEGLIVDEGMNLSHLKGVVELLLRQIFRSDLPVKFRPSFFPFTEPSAEVDIQCVICAGKGCRVCGGTGWLEVMGCGMVDPAVFHCVKINPKKYSGFAFGLGVERIAMLKYGIGDIRLFFENSIRFLEQF